MKKLILMAALLLSQNVVLQAQEPEIGSYHYDYGPDGYYVIYRYEGDGKWYCLGRFHRQI